MDMDSGDQGDQTPQPDLIPGFQHRHMRRATQVQLAMGTRTMLPAYVARFRFSRAYIVHQLTG